MGNPYEILGVREGASQEEIKAAYKEKVKKYHPDKYQNNPLSDLAEEKLQEINEAYDYLTKFGGATNGSGSAGQGSRAEFQQIRKDLDSGNLGRAEAGLNRVAVKNAEWVFLNGMLSYKKGWYDDAMANIQQACSMDPSNSEYKRALNTLMYQGQNYRNAATGRGYKSNEDLMCQACQCYLCADCCCDCI